MTESYRLYLLDALGHIHRAEWIDANSDEEAIARATQRSRTLEQNCELWLLERKVVSIGEKANRVDIDGSSQLWPEW